MSKCTGRFYDRLRDEEVVIERVPEDGGLLAYGEGPSAGSWRTSELQVRRAVDKGDLVRRGAGSVPDSRGEGSVDPEFDFGGGF